MLVLKFILFKLTSHRQGPCLRRNGPQNTIPSRTPGIWGLFHSVVFQGRRVTKPNSQKCLCLRASLLWAQGCLWRTPLMVSPYPVSAPGDPRGLEGVQCCIKPCWACAGPPPHAVAPHRIMCKCKFVKVT